MKLNYKRLGEGEPIVILHGLFGMLDNWMSFGKHLSQDYQVIFVDQRNHGKSPHSDEVGYNYYVHDLFELIHELGISKAHILGHSMGGKTAMNFAVAHPKLTSSLISIDMGAHGYYTANHDEIFRAILSIDLKNYQTRSEVDSELEKSISEIGIRQFLLKNLERAETGYAWKANFKALHTNYDKLRKEVKAQSPFYGKALFVRGGNSKYIRDTDFDYIKSIFPNARLETIAGAGHWVHVEKQMELLAVLKTFLE